MVNGRNAKSMMAEIKAEQQKRFEKAVDDFEKLDDEEQKRDL